MYNVDWFLRAQSLQIVRYGDKMEIYIDILKWVAIAKDTDVLGETANVEFITTELKII